MDMRALRLANDYYDQMEEHQSLHENCRADPCEEAQRLRRLAIEKAKGAFLPNRVLARNGAGAGSSA